MPARISFENLRQATRGTLTEVVWVVPCSSPARGRLLPRLPGREPRLVHGRDRDRAQRAPITEPWVIIGLRDETTPRFIACTPKHCTPLGYGFYHIGLFAEEVVLPGPEDIEAICAALERFDAANTGRASTRLRSRSERRVVRHPPLRSLAQLLFRLLFRPFFRRFFSSAGFSDDLESGHGDGRDLDRGVFLPVTGVPARVLAAAELADFELFALHLGLDHGRLDQGAGDGRHPDGAGAPGVGQKDLLKAYGVSRFGPFPVIDNAGCPPPRRDIGGFRR